MPPMEVDAAYQGCLPSCELHSRSLTVGRTGKVRRLRTRVTQSPDCAHVLRNLEIRTQSRDSENAQRNLEIAQILRLRGTSILSSGKNLTSKNLHPGRNFATIM